VLNSDYKDMLQVLLDHGVKFLLDGAYAMGAHRYPRAADRDKDRLDADQLEK
jgi:hypothetical protein